ncbi:uncharacterized protein LOC135210028 [Macrobrachium nipponense]|uniref:uncharacterized protein LOC135210028 n=1 Tax=Macrobrachium nipponense TaxID=159736 RepID=UPI0030C87BCD
MEVQASGKAIYITLKVFEIVFVIIAIAIYQSLVDTIPIDDTYGGIFFCDGSLFMAIVITPLMLIFGVIGQSNGPMFEAALNLVFGIFLIATGSLAIDLYRVRAVHEPLACGSMCILAAIFYLGDCAYSSYLAAKNSGGFTTSTRNDVNRGMSNEPADKDAGS